MKEAVAGPVLKNMPVRGLRGKWVQYYFMAIDLPGWDIGEIPPVSLEETDYPDRRMTLLILLDHSLVFDTICHGIILDIFYEVKVGTCISCISLFLVQVLLEQY